MIIISERTTLYFQYAGTFHPATINSALGFVRGIKASADKATAIFEHIIITRSFLRQAGFGPLNHGQQATYIKGPLSSEKFSRILECKSGLSAEAWTAFMDTFRERSAEQLEGSES